MGGLWEQRFVAHENTHQRDERRYGVIQPGDPISKMTRTETDAYTTQQAVERAYHLRGFTVGPHGENYVPGLVKGDVQGECGGGSTCVLQE